MDQPTVSFTEQSHPATTVVDAKTADEFIELVTAPAFRPSRFQKSDELIFRGVGNSRHELVPMALRECEADNLRAIVRLDIQHNYQAASGQHQAELEVLRHFYQHADIHGLALPDVGLDLHQYLSVSVVSYESFSMQKRAYEQFGATSLDVLDQEWPEIPYQPLLGLAQHFGLPTRLLDWTFDPLVAIYFATRNGLTHLEKNGDRNDYDCPSHIAVWFTSWPLLYALAKYSNSSDRLVLVRVPRSWNINMASQRGTFTLYKYRLVSRDVGHRMVEPIDRRGLNAMINDDFIPNSINRVSEGQKARIPDELSIECPFRMVRLNIKESPKLLFALRRRGYTAARLFPGFGGAAKSVKELALAKSFLVPWK